VRGCRTGSEGAPSWASTKGEEPDPLTGVISSQPGASVACMGSHPTAEGCTRGAHLVDELGEHTHSLRQLRSWVRGRGASLALVGLTVGTPIVRPPLPQPVGGWCFPRWALRQGAWRNLELAVSKGSMGLSSSNVRCGGASFRVGSWALRGGGRQSRSSARGVWKRRRNQISWWRAPWRSPALGLGPWPGVSRARAGAGVPRPCSAGLG